MKLDRFKELKPTEHQFDVTDSEYVKKLNTLSKRKNKTQVLSIVGTIAAAVAIVLVVGIWAIIGRGVRGNNVPATSPTDYVEIELIDDVYISLINDVIYKYDVLCFKDFNEQYPLSVHEILRV